MTVVTVKLKDLDENFIEELKSKHQDLDQEVTFWTQKKSNAMPEDEFWYIISLFDWTEKDDDKILLNAVKYLSELSEDKIKAFQDILSEKLFLLDGQQHAENIGNGAYKEVDSSFSVDLFLYARCCVIANGKSFYEKVLDTPNEMPKNTTFEAILSLAAKAFFIKTNEFFQYTPAYIYETFANKEGWKGNSFLSKILG